MEMLNIALPKGRLGEKVYTLLKSVGYPCPSIEEENRKLIFENAENFGVFFIGFIVHKKVTLVF